MVAKLSHEDYVNRLFDKTKGAISVVETYVLSTTKIKHQCNDCNRIFLCKPLDMLHNHVHGCRDCGFKIRTKQLTKKGFVYAKEALDLGWNIRNKDYVNDNTKINHTCIHCKTERALYPNQILCQGAKCHCKWKSRNYNISPNGSPIGVSKISKLWFECLEKRYRIKIQHAWNGGEHVVFYKKRKIYVDGYNKRKKIVFEFYGDVFHGNPNVYSSKIKCHPFDKDITAGELLVKTRQRTAILKKLGYRVLYVWERDFIKFDKLFSGYDRL